MQRKALIIPVLFVALSVGLGLRVRARGVFEHTPSGGSATIEGTNLYVSSKTAGRVLDVTVQKGDRVRKGDLVAKLDCLDQESVLAATLARVRSAEAGILAAESAATGAKDNVAVTISQLAAAQAAENVVLAEKELTEKNRQRVVSLYESGAVSEGELDTVDAKNKGIREQQQAAQANTKTATFRTSAAKSNVASVSAHVVTAKAALDVAKADARRAEIAVAECTLVAPRDGIVVDRIVEPGAVIAPGSQVVSLVDTSVVKATFFLPNAELARARIGAAAEVRVDAFPDKVFQGKVRRVAAEAEFTPRNVQTREDRDRLVYAVEVQLENPDGLLRPGMPADVVLPGTGR